MKIYSGEKSEFLKTALFRAVDVFEKRGFKFMDLPLCEPYRLQEKALGTLSRNSLTFRDFESGEIMALRLDFTTLVVNQVIQRGIAESPQRYYYFGKVFRYTETLEEHTESGIEILGDSSVEADAAVIEGIYSYVKSLGLEDIIVSVGHVGIVEKLLEEVEPQRREEARRYFIEKNITSLSEVLKLPGVITAGDLILAQGQGEVLKLLEKLGLEKIAQELNEAGRYLSKEGVEFIFDLTEIREFPYYSGIIFELFYREIGSPIAGGGRYDRLVTTLGGNFPATGGAVYLSKLAP